VAADPRDGGADAAPAAVHDFAAKLQQPALWPAVRDYVAWQQKARAAANLGQPLPDLPDRAPLSINLDLTTACNYACDHCIDWDILNQKQKHDDELLRAALERMVPRGLRSVILIGGGEPTLYPGFVPFVQFLKQLGLQVAVVSNGSRNDRILQAAQYLGAGDWVRLSLDAASNDLWRRMHKPQKATLTLDEICSFVPAIKAAQPALQMGFSFVITWRGGSRGAVEVHENLHEMAAAAARAAQSGFDYISFKPFLERQDDGAEVLDPAKVRGELAAVLARIEQGLRAARAATAGQPGFRVVVSTNLRVLLAGTWRDYTQQPRTCHMQMLRQVLTPLGTFNCPAHRGVGKAQLGAAELWTVPAAGQAATAGILGRFDAGVECQQVTCLYHGANWWLEGLIEAGADLPVELPVEERRDWFL
jgi:sulfatase maturation enzyme AslB (radical SAM superfamily)